MAGSAEFPRGWSQVSFNNAGLASVVLPGVAGIVRVLEAVTAVVAVTAAGGPGDLGGYQLQATDSGGLFTNEVLDVAWIPAANGSAELSASGLELATSVGGQLTVKFSFSSANTVEFMLAQGHDV